MLLRFSRISLRSQSTAYSEILLKTPAAHVRNTGIIAHVDAGKTTTTERLLFYSGVTGRIGDVDEGDTVTDFLAAERERGVTIQSAAVTIPWHNTKINVVDTPGHADFTFEVARSLRVVDGAVVVLDGVAGVEPQTERVWQQAKQQQRLPAIVYVNKMDRDGAGYGRTVLEVAQALKVRAPLVNMPYFDPQGKFTGVIDVMSQKALIWDTDADPDGKTINVESLTGDLAEQASLARGAMVDILSEYDESLVEAYLECDGDPLAVSTDLLKKALRQATLKAQVVPILCGSSFRNIGVQPLMDAIVDYLPSPLDTPAPVVTSMKKDPKHKKALVPCTLDSIMDNNGCTINANKNLTAALAFKVVNHPNRGLMTYVRVYSGKLIAGSTLYNSTTGEKVKIGKLLVMNGETPLDVKYLTAGNIGVITGSNDISTGDTLVGHALNKKLSPLESTMKLLPINVPPPVFSVSIEPKTIGQKRDLVSHLEMMLKEDPSLQLSFDEETNQLVLAGMGELHLEITRDRLVNDMKVQAEIGDVRVTYKETVTKPTPQATKISEDGFGITLSVLPFESSPDEVLEFESFDSSLTQTLNENNFAIFSPEAQPESILKALQMETWPSAVSYDKIMNSIQSGCIGALQIGGQINHLPLHSLVVKVESFTLPPLNEMQTAAPLIQLTRQAIIEALCKLSENDRTLLEPIMGVKVYVSNEYVGAVSQDLMGARHAQITDVVATSETNEDEGNSNNGDIYVPPDATLQYMKSHAGDQKMVIHAQAPLRGMLGYLSKLRSLTKGRGGLDMELEGMKRCSKGDVKDILG